MHLLESSANKNHVRVGMNLIEMRKEIELIIMLYRNVPVQSEIVIYCIPVYLEVLNS